MSYGPRAMELGAQLIGRIFKKLLKLDGIRAWCLVLGAWRLVLGGFYILVCVLGMEILRLAAWCLELFPVAVGHGPCFMDLVYFNVLGM